jgi:DNA-directed RNA polymerase subunit RPC12/RpoP
MEKYGVDEHQNDEQLEKLAGAACPECGSKIEIHGSTAYCPRCGTAPFEKRSPR